MLQFLRDRFNRAHFALACRGVLRTAPVRTDPQSRVLLLSQLQHKDVLMGLIAFKSFASRVSVGQLRIVDDGSLTRRDLALLRKHLPGVEFLDKEAVRTPACPVGGCWERLLWIAQLSREHYIVQLDSDTVTLQDLDEVVECIRQDRSFALGTWSHQEIEPMSWRQSESTRVLKTEPLPHHVQLVAEVGFQQLQEFSSLRYVRGCAGFSGFARGSVDIGFIESISRRMSQAIGNDWGQWGTEQVMSNIVVANSARPVVLSYPEYCDCNRIRPGVTAFVHFIGEYRFVGTVYEDCARGAIAQLHKPACA